MPRGHVDRLKGSLPTCPPGSTTTSDSDCWVPHETTRGRLNTQAEDLVAHVAVFKLAGTACAAQRIALQSAQRPQAARQPAPLTAPVEPDFQ